MAMIQSLLRILSNYPSISSAIPNERKYPAPWSAHVFPERCREPCVCPPRFSVCCCGIASTSRGRRAVPNESPHNGDPPLHSTPFSCPQTSAVAMLHIFLHIACIYIYFFFSFLNKGIVCFWSLKRCDDCSLFLLNSSVQVNYLF